MMRHIARHRSVRPLSLLLSVSLFSGALPLSPTAALAAGEEAPIVTYEVQSSSPCNVDLINVLTAPTGDTSDSNYGWIVPSSGFMYIGGGQYIKDVVTVVLTGPKSWSRWAEIRNSLPMPDKSRGYQFEFTGMPPGSYSGTITVTRTYRRGGTCSTITPIAFSHQGYQENPVITEITPEVGSGGLTVAARLAPTGDPTAHDYGTMSLAGKMYVGCDWISEQAHIRITAYPGDGSNQDWDFYRPIASTTAAPDKGRIYAAHVPYTAGYTYGVYVKVDRDYYYGDGGPFSATEIVSISQDTLSEKKKLGRPEGAAFESEPVNVATGNFILPATDVKQTGSGGLGLARFYNSSEDDSGVLGRGWTHTYARSLEFHSQGRVAFVDADGRRDVFKEQPDGAYLAEDPWVHSHLTKETDGSYRLVLKDKTTLSFCRYGNLTKIADRNGNETRVNYSCGKPTLVTDPYGRTLSLSYNQDGRLSQVTDWAGRTWSYRYDVTGTLSEVEDPAGAVTRYCYDQSSRLTQIVEPEGNITIQNTYDSEGRVTEQVNAVGETASFTYDTEGKRTTVTDAAGETTVHTFDEAGRALSRTDQEGRTTSYAYDSNGNRSEVTDAKGRTTHLTYDSRGNLTRVTDRKGAETQLSYDAEDNLTSLTDATGAEYQMAYDTASNLTAITDPAGAATQFTYDSRGRPVTVTDAKGKATSLLYDTAGNLASVTDPTGATCQYSYDAAGNLTLATDPNGRATQLAYDILGRLTQLTNPVGDTVGYAYDANGNLTRITDGKGNPTEYAYDGLNRLTQVTDALGHVTGYSYNHLWNLTSVTDAKGAVTGYSYDGAGGLVKVTDPDGSETHFAVDPNGNRREQTDALGRKSTYSYNEADQLTGITYFDSSSTGFSYDTLGRIHTMHDTSGTTSYSYDTVGRLSSVTDPAGQAVSYAYDALGLKTALTYPDGKQVRYAYDQADRLTEVTDWQSRKTTYTYDPAGELLASTLPNGTKASCSYDPAGRLTALSNTAPSGKSLISFTYGYDSNGNRTYSTRDDTKEITVTAYSYDNLNQLTSAEERASRGSNILKETRSYAYDEVGNRTSFGYTNRSGVTKETTYAYNAASELTGSRDTTDKRTLYCFDPEGNEVTKAEVTSSETKTTTYAYSPAGKLSGVTLPNGKKLSYSYDGMGNRVDRTLTLPDGTAKTTSYLNDISGPLTQVLQSTMTGGKSQTCAYGLQRISSTLTGPPEIVPTPKTDYFLYDGLGSVVGQTSEQANLTRFYAYDEWGIPSTNSNFKDEGNPNTYGFTGEDWDPDAELLYLRARYYEPAVGRFSAPDMQGGIRSFAMLYTYAFNAPADYVDPAGTWGYAVHYTLTRQWAKDVGFSWEAAKEIAKGDLATDSAPYASRSNPANPGRHGNMTPADPLPSQLRYAAAELAVALATGSLFHLGLGLHSVQDYIGHGGPMSVVHPFLVKLSGSFGVTIEPYEPTPARNPTLAWIAEQTSKLYLAIYRAVRPSREGVGGP